MGHPSGKFRLLERVAPERPEKPRFAAISKGVALGLTVCTFHFELVVALGLAAWNLEFSPSPSN